MARDTIQECYRILQLASEDHDDFKTEAIDDAEHYQTYHRDLLDIPKDDIKDYTIDFFLNSTNLSRWWPKWSEAQRQSWLSNDRVNLEQALVTLFEHWIDDRRVASRRSYLTVLKPNHTTSKSHASAKQSPSDSRSKQATETPRRRHIDQEFGDTSFSDIVTTTFHATRPNTTDMTAQTPITPQTTNGSLSDIDHALSEDETGQDDTDGIPSLAEILRSPSRPRGGRQESRTIEPQSPTKNVKPRRLVDEEDSTYVESQPSTLGQAPISPPPTRHKAKLKRKHRNEISDDETDEDPVTSPLMKRSRPQRTRKSFTSTDASGNHSTEDEEVDQASQIAVNISSHAHTREEETNTTSIEVTRNETSEELQRPTGSKHESNGSDAFEELAHMLQQYLYECGKNSLRRANDPQISKREAERLHMRSGILEHLHSDVVSRIEAVRARQQGLDKSDEISWCTFYS